MSITNVQIHCSHIYGVQIAHVSYITLFLLIKLSQVCSLKHQQRLVEKIKTLSDQIVQKTDGVLLIGFLPLSAYLRISFTDSWALPSQLMMTLLS